MHWYSYARSVVWTSICVAASLAAPVCFGADAHKTQAQAQLLDHAEFSCSNCFFGASKHYYCFAADNKVLIAYQKTPVLNWEDQSKNYLEPVRPAWTAWTSPGASVPISYDGKYIWISRPEPGNVAIGFWAHLRGAEIWATHGKGKRVKLTRSTMGDIFLNDDRCRAAGAAKTR